MIHFWRVAGWLAALVLALLTTSMLLLGLWLHAAVLALAALLCWPPATSLSRHRFGRDIHPSSYSST